MAEYGGQAVFLSAGGYHHHVGANTWRSGGALPPDPGAAALRRFEVVLPDAAERDALVARIADGGVDVEDDPAGPAGARPVAATRSCCSARPRRHSAARRRGESSAWSHSSLSRSYVDRESCSQAHDQVRGLQRER